MASNWSSYAAPSVPAERGPVCVCVCVLGSHPAVKQSLSSERRQHHNLLGSLTRRRRSQRDVGERPRPPGRSFSRLYPLSSLYHSIPHPGWLLFFLFLYFLRLSGLLNAKKVIQPRKKSVLQSEERMATRPECGTLWDSGLSERSGVEEKTRAREEKKRESPKQKPD